MKKLSMVALSLFITTSVFAQDVVTGAAGTGSGAAGAGAGLGTIGGIATGTVVAGAIAAGVLTAVVSNNRSESAPDVEPVLSCNGTDPLVNGLCVGTNNIVSVVNSGTGTGTLPGSVTATRTITTPVTFTYAPTQG